MGSWEMKLTKERRTCIYVTKEEAESLREIAWQLGYFHHIGGIAHPSITRMLGAIASGEVQVIPKSTDWRENEDHP